MIKVFISTIIIVGCFILSGCSYSVLYAVINKSKAPIEIEYVLTSKVNSLENTSSKPFKTTLSNWNAWFEKEEEWHAVPQDEYEFNPETRKCKIKLNPNEVLKINWQDDGILMTENYENFYIESLKINGANGVVAYEGKYFYKQFEKKNETNYFIAYR